MAMATGSCGGDGDGERDVAVGSVDVVTLGVTDVVSTPVELAVVAVAVGELEHSKHEELWRWWWELWWWELW
jgi:hypothetical protein